MAFDKAMQYLTEKGYADRVQTFDVSSATVELAAIAVGTEPSHIAKSLTFLLGEQALMVVCAGDMKVNSGKFKARFGVKAKMLTREQVHGMIGHDVGGVCPFGIHPGVEVCLDESLRRFEFVYPACGSDNSAVKLTPEEFAEITNAQWVDVCIPMG